MTTPGAREAGRGPLVALALALAVIVAHARVVAGGDTWSDTRYHTEVAPSRFAAADAVQHAEAPAWWDGTGLGVPLLAEPSHGAMYPPIWLAATPHALDLVMIAHLWWAALGVALWARRRLGASDAAALVAGLLVATTGVLASAAVRGSLVALAHVPWIALAAGGLAAARTRRDRARSALALGALVGAIGLSGELGVLVDALALALVLAARRDTLAWLAGALAAGLAIGAAQWLPAVAELATAAGAEVRGMPLARLLELVVPGCFGASDSEHAVRAIAGDAPWAPSLFVGAPLLALAAVRPPGRRLAGLIIALAAAAFVVGRGGWPAWLGAPELHVAVLAVVLAAHASIGLDALVAGERRAIVAVGVGAACTAIALGAMGAWRVTHAETPILPSLVDGGLGVLCVAGALLLAARRDTDRGWVRTTFVFALIAVPSAGAVPLVAPVIDRALVDDPPAWVELARHATPPRRLYRPVFMGAEALEPDVALATLAGAFSARWDIAAARSEDPARPTVHDRVWLAASYGGYALLDRYGIALAILPMAVVDPQHMTALGRRGTSALVEIPVAPPASVAHGWLRAVAPDDALALLFASGSPRGFPRGTIVLAEPGESHDAPGAPPTPCTIDRWDPGDIAVTCTAEADAYAVVSSTAAAGWSVTVDGDDTRWVTADLFRRAVPMTRGTHRIVWRYRTPGLRAGVGALLVGLLMLGGLWFAGRR